MRILNHFPLGRFQDSNWSQAQSLKKKDIYRSSRECGMWLVKHSLSGYLHRRGKYVGSISHAGAGRGRRGGGSGRGMGAVRSKVSTGWVQGCDAFVNRCVVYILGIN